MKCVLSLRDSQRHASAGNDIRYAPIREKNSGTPLIPMLILNRAPAPWPSLFVLSASAGVARVVGYDLWFHGGSLREGKVRYSDGCTSSSGFLLPNSGSGPPLGAAHLTPLTRILRTSS